MKAQIYAETKVDSYIIRSVFSHTPTCHNNVKSFKHGNNNGENEEKLFRNVHIQSFI